MSNTIKFAAFEASVFQALVDGLYAEHGFSDVEARDIAKQLKAKQQAVGGAISSLIQKGLVSVEDTDVNGRPHTFLHLTDAGCEFHPEWFSEVGHPAHIEIEVAA